MQAFEAEETVGRKGDDTKGQFGYGSVLEEGNATTAKNPHEPQNKKRNKAKWSLGLLALGLVAAGIALIVIFRHEKEPSAAEQFEQYKLQFSKSYTAEELMDRFEAFKENIAEIKVLSALNGKATFGWNKFTDMDQSEFAAKYLGFRRSDQSSTNVQAAPQGVSSGPTLTTLDWDAEGVVPPVRDQGYCGSCWAYATVASIETKYIMDNSMSSSDVEDFELSVQQMVSCDNQGYNGGCNGGDPPGAFEWVTANGGLAHADDYPYTSYEGSTGSCTNGVEPLDGTLVDSWAYATDACTSTNCNSQDEEKMAASVESEGPITVCVNASYWQFYTGGVFTGNQCGRSGYWALNHCVQLTGYNLDADEPYWILRNSWAEDWGEDGYMRVSYGENTCGVADEALYAVSLS